MPAPRDHPVMPDTRPAALSTLSPPPERDARSVRAADASAFDVCRGALALRAVLIVNAAVLVATAVAVDNATQLPAAIGPVLAMSLPATLAWLLLVCALRRVLLGLSPPARIAALMALGALLALASAWPLAAIDLLPLSTLRLLTLPLAGAALDRKSVV